MMNMTNKEDFLRTQITDAHTWMIDNDISERKCFIRLDKDAYRAHIIHIIDFGNTTLVGFKVDSKIYDYGEEEQCDTLIYAPADKIKIAFNYNVCEDDE